MSPFALVEHAPAKINLSLHIVGRRADGFHELESLVAFTASGDTLTLFPGEPLSLDVEGPTAPNVGALADNLVLRAARALSARVPDLKTGRFHLLKRLPVAAGIGGGSSDAGASLRLLARLNGIALDDPRLHDAACEIGSDVPVCVAAQARMMLGRGERIGQLVKLPRLFAVLVNPAVPLETKAVFARIGLKAGQASGFGPHPAISENMSVDALVAAMKKSRNDMEDAASVLAPVVGHCLAVLSAARGAKIARMSGSGSTCFAVFDDCRAAKQAACVIRRDHPEWWVKSALLR